MTHLSRVLYMGAGFLGALMLMAALLGLWSMALVDAGGALGVVIVARMCEGKAGRA